MQPHYLFPLVLLKLLQVLCILSGKQIFQQIQKYFLINPDGSIKVISSASGNSTMHFVDISNLISGTLYNYTIEAIANNQVDKNRGFFQLTQILLHEWWLNC